VRAHARAKVAVLIGPGQGGDSPMFAHATVFHRAVLLASILIRLRD
jgi:hypothetical protein